MFPGFRGWKEQDDQLWTAQDDSSHSKAHSCVAACAALNMPVRAVSYINLNLNPESYTGYEGADAWRMWDAIYQENCFHGPQIRGEATPIFKVVLTLLLLPLLLQGQWTRCASSSACSTG
jgi:hypothetical protein